MPGVGAAVGAGVVAGAVVGAVVGADAVFDAGAVAGAGAVTVAGAGAVTVVGAVACAGPVVRGGCRMRAEGCMRAGVTPLMRCLLRGSVSILARRDFVKLLQHLLRRTNDRGEVLLPQLQVG